MIIKEAVRTKAIIIINKIIKSRAIKKELLLKSTDKLKRTKRRKIITFPKTFKPNIFQK